jgi:hypothetical protein
VADPKQKEKTPRRQLSPDCRAKVSKAWAQCLADPETPTPFAQGTHAVYNGSTIPNLIIEGIRGQMEDEGKFFKPEDEVSIFFEISGVVLPRHLTVTGGLESFLMEIEDQFLNGWPFQGEKPGAKRTLSDIVRLRVKTAIKESVSNANVAREDVAGILATEIMSKYYLETEETSAELFAVFDTVMDSLGQRGLEEFFDSFESEVLNHPLLKDAPPEQQEIPET